MLKSINCPRCAIPLEKKSYQMILRHQCPSCRGFLVKTANLKAAAPVSLLKKLQANLTHSPSSTQCPLCTKNMLSVNFEKSQTNEIELDICNRCQVTWLDYSEWDELKRSKDLSTTESSEEKQLRTRIATTLVELEKDKSRSQQKSITEFVERSEISTDESFLLSLKLPVEESEDNFVESPIISRMIIFIWVIASVIGFFKQKLVLEYFSFSTNHAFVKNIYTWLTSLFFHQNIGSLIFNTYFFWIFSDNVEDDLGEDNFLVLLLVSTALSEILFWIFDRSGIYILGPSPLIAVCIGYYITKFPHRRFILPYLNVSIFNLIAVRIAAFWIGLTYAIGSVVSALIVKDGYSVFAFIALNFFPFLIGVGYALLKTE